MSDKTIRINGTVFDLDKFYVMSEDETIALRKFVDDFDRIREERDALKKQLDESMNAYVDALHLNIHQQIPVKVTPLCDLQRERDRAVELLTGGEESVNGVGEAVIMVNADKLDEFLKGLKDTDDKH